MKQNFDTSELGQKFAIFVKDNKLYQESLAVVRDNSEGNVWLIGGFLYRNLVSILYGNQASDGIDLDFLVERPRKKLKLPSKWESTKNSFGGTKLISPNSKIDFIPLDIVFYIKMYGLPANLENFLKFNPLTIQSLAYHTGSCKLAGPKGLDSLRKKLVTVHYEPAAEHEATRKGMNIEQYVDRLATSIGFNKDKI